jgi:hypothetical protein
VGLAGGLLALDPLPSDPLLLLPESSLLLSDLLLLLLSSLLLPLTP